MAKVFVVNLPMRKNPDSAAFKLRPGIDLAPAAEWGEVRHVLPPGRTSPDPLALVAGVAAGLDEFEDGDRLVFCGDLVACSIAGAIAIEKGGGVLRWLIWRGDRYAPAEVRIWAKEDA